jgi:hypothetical protein
MQLPPRFQLRLVIVRPGEPRPFVADEWGDALVLVEQGAIELEGCAGGRWRFEAGGMLWFAGLSPRALCNPGTAPTVLIAISKRTDESRPSTPS